MREQQAMGPRCSSAACIKSAKHRCSAIGEPERNNIFMDFWQHMTWEEKRVFVCDLIDVVPCKGEGGLKIPKDQIPCCCYFYGSAGREDASAKICFCPPSEQASGLHLTGQRKDTCKQTQRDKHTATLFIQWQVMNSFAVFCRTSQRCPDTTADPQHPNSIWDLCFSRWLICVQCIVTLQQRRM